MCKQSKPVEDFSVRSATRDGRQYYCKECGKKHYKKWADRTPETKSRYSDWKKVRRDAVRKSYLEFLKTQICVDCGNSDYRVLEFDHVADDKFAGVAELINRGRNWKDVQAEIAKCEVRCCNCHRIQTMTRGNWWIMAG